MFVRATALVLTACAASPSLASEITFRFDGTMTANIFTSGPWVDADVGDAFAVQFTFESGSADSDPSATIGDFRNCISEFILFAGTAFESGVGGSIEVRNTAADEYHVFLDLNGDFFAEVNLTASGGLPFADDSLPTNLTLADWSDRTFGILHDDTPEGGSAAGVITSFTLVPAPGAAAILSAVLFGAARRRR